jgi:hypothetical protein
MKRAAVPSILVVVVLLAVAAMVEAQQPKKVARIGYLSAFDAASESTRSEGIRLALRELGYIATGSLPWLEARMNRCARAGLRKTALQDSRSRRFWIEPSDNFVLKHF